MFLSIRPASLKHTSLKIRLSADRQRGSALLMAMAIMVIGSLVVMALMSYAQVSLRTATTYRNVTEREQAASDAIELVITEIRPDRKKGSTGGTPTVTVTYDGASATCTADPGSGVANPVGGYADRTVRCAGSYASKELVWTRVQLLDSNGEEPGAVAQELERRVGS